MADIKQFMRNEDQSLSRKITGLLFFKPLQNLSIFLIFQDFSFYLVGLILQLEYIGPAPDGWRNLNSTGQVHLE